jgi:hypothetical protein
MLNIILIIKIHVAIAIVKPLVAVSLLVHIVVVVMIYWDTYYDCNCYNDCCHSTICAYYQCTWFFGVDSQMLTGKTTPYSPPATSFFASASGDLISQQYGY